MRSYFVFLLRKGLITWQCDLWYTWLWLTRYENCACEYGHSKMQLVWVNHTRIFTTFTYMVLHCVLTCLKTGFLSNVNKWIKWRIHGSHLTYRAWSYSIVCELRSTLKYENSTLCTNWFVHHANTTGAFIVHHVNTAGAFIVHQGNAVEHFGSYIKAERSSPTLYRLCATVASNYLQGPQPPRIAKGDEQVIRHADREPPWTASLPVAKNNHI